MNTKPRSRTAAFTLIELLVALTIIIILTVLAVPALGPMLAVGGVEGAAATLKGALVHARSTAIAEHRTSMCWVASGSVVDSGTLQLIMGSGAELLTVDNLDAEFTCSPGVTGSTSTGWGESGSVDEHADSLYTTRLNGATATWTLALPQAGVYEVYAWWTAKKSDGTFYDRDSQASYTTTHAGGSSTVQVNQNNDSATWVLLGSYSFNADGTENVTVEHDAEDSNNTCADAIRICDTGDSAVNGDTKFKAFDDDGATAKDWPDDKWSESAADQPRYYVTLANRKSGASSYTIQPATAPIETNKQNATDAIVTIGTTWKTASSDAFEEPTPGSQFLIHLGNPGQTGVRQQSAGSGTEAAMRWDALPEGFAVRPTDPVTGDNVLPLSFEPNGRARIVPAYITLQVYSEDEVPDPDNPNPDYCRYLRVFRNTGRVVTARTIDALPE